MARASERKFWMSPFPTPRRRAFTLIEVLVVLLIMVLLAGIVIPAVVIARKHAKATRTELDMRSLASALEEYKKDHGGQYPKTNGAQNTGFAVLGRELAGVYGEAQWDSTTGQLLNPPPNWDGTKTYKPGDAVLQGNPPSLNQPNTTVFVCLSENTGQTPVPTSTVWALFLPVRQSVGVAKKRTYVQEGKYHLRGCAILDPDDHAFLYFPATGNPNVNLPVNGGPSFVSDAVGPNKFNANDNIQFFIRPNDAGGIGVNALRRIRVMVGDTNFDGIINNGETAAHNGSYILWAPGPDGFYGPKTADDNAPLTQTVISKCDDIIVTTP